jgi:hypothetical protein
VTANAQNLAVQAISDIHEAVEKVEKVTSNWARLIARIYEVNPLICTGCGKNIRIISVVTHREAIWRILKGIGLPTDIPEFDPAYDIKDRDICQLIPGTKDGFWEASEYVQPDIGPDPPHWQDHSDPPHWED